MRSPGLNDGIAPGRAAVGGFHHPHELGGAYVEDGVLVEQVLVDPGVGVVQLGAVDLVGGGAFSKPFL